MRILCDCGCLKVDKWWFTNYDWSDFYRNVKESIPSNKPEASGLRVLVTCFVDVNYGGNLENCKSQIGILIFINKVPIY